MINEKLVDVDEISGELGITVQSVHYLVNRLWDITEEDIDSMKQESKEAMLALAYLEAGKIAKVLFDLSLRLKEEAEALNNAVLHSMEEQTA